MPNPFNVIGNAGAGANNPMLQMVNQFNQFRQSFKGNPQQAVQQMLNSGQISQEQVNKAMQAAKQFQQFLPK